MKFVEQNHTDIGERTILLKPTEEDTFCYKTDAGAEAGLVIKTDLIADFGAQFDFALIGDPGSDCSCRDAAGLEDDDFFVTCEASIQHHLRHLGGFA